MFENGQSIGAGTYEITNLLTSFHQGSYFDKGFLSLHHETNVDISSNYVFMASTQTTVCDTNNIANCQYQLLARKQSNATIPYIPFLFSTDTWNETSCLNNQVTFFIPVNNLPFQGLFVWFKFE